MPRRLTIDEFIVMLHYIDVVVGDVVIGDYHSLQCVSKVIRASCREYRCQVQQARPLRPYSVREENLNDLRDLVGLRMLNLEVCTLLRDLSPLSSLTGLQTLNINVCPSLKSLSPLSHLSMLRQLTLRYTTLELSVLSHLVNLEVLDIGCSSIQDLSLLTKLTGLKELQLDSCWEVTSLSPLANTTTNIEKLSLERSWNIRDIVPLASFTALKELNLTFCSCSLRPLSSLIGLRTLHLTDVPKWILDQDLSTLTALREIVL